VVRTDLGEAQPEQTPRARGFDHSLGYFGGQEDYYLHNVNAPWPNASNDSSTPHKTCNAKGSCQCELIDLWQSSPQGQGPAPLELTGEYSMFFYTARAVESIEAQAEAAADDNATGDSRLFLYFASQLIHDPHQVPQRYIDLYPPTKECPAAAAAGGCDCCGRRTVMAMMSALDESVANITAALERTELINNTLVVFASDNGGVVADHGSNVPLRGVSLSCAVWHVW
jgi:arylsulfatase A-like enzyme